MVVVDILSEEMDIFKFTKDVLGIELLPYQEEALRRMEKGETVVIVPARTATTLELAEAESRLRKIWDEYRRRFKKKDVWGELCEKFDEALSMQEYVVPKSLIDRWNKVKAAGDELKQKAAIFDAWEEERCGYFKPGYGCTSPTGIGNSVMCRKLPNCEVLTDELLWKQIKTARNKLYEDLPTGDVDAFDLLKVVQTHIAKLDKILEDT